MKSFLYFINKYGYDNGQDYYESQLFNPTTTIIDDIDENMKRRENKEDPDEQEKNEEYCEKCEKEDCECEEDPSLQPTEFYSNMYGYTGLEGAQSYPMEYYSGDIASDPQALTNSWYNTYQSASNKTKKIRIRMGIWKDLAKK